MGGGRARAAAVVALTGLTAFLASGCGESRHANDQRPQVTTQVSVTISPTKVIVQPPKVAMGPEKFQESPQNQNHPEPPLKRKGPLGIVFITANQTGTDFRLKIRGPKEVESDPVFAHSPRRFQFDLPSGSYTISAMGMPGAEPAHLTVGSYRASSQNDVLTP
jgi:hypothetical protein